MPTRTSTSRTSVCPPEQLLFADLGRCQIVADFSSGYLSSDGGALLLRQVDASLGLNARLAQAFADERDQSYCDHQPCIDQAGWFAILPSQQRHRR